MVCFNFSICLNHQRHASVTNSNACYALTCVSVMGAYPPPKRGVAGDAIYRKVNIVIETA